MLTRKKTVSRSLEQKARSIALPSGKQAPRKMDNSVSISLSFHGANP